MRRIGSQRSVLSAREHSENWGGFDSPPSTPLSSSFDDDRGEDYELLPAGGLSRTYPLHPVLSNALRVPSCEHARTLLAVGWYEEALRISYEEKDTILSAAALVLTGNARGALQAMEAHIVTSAALLYDMGYHSRGAISPRISSVQQRYQSLLHDWLECRASGQEADSQVALTRASNRAHRVVVLWQTQLLDWELWRRWYILALLLINPSDSADEDEEPAESPEHAPRTETTGYAVPRVSWLRCFFGLQQAAKSATGASGGVAAAGTSSHGSSYGMWQGDRQAGPRNVADPGPWTSRTTDQILAELLAQCCEEEVSLITAIAATHTQRYRSAMIFASRFLEAAPAPACTAERQGHEAVPARSPMADAQTAQAAQAAQNRPQTVYQTQKDTGLLPYRARPEDLVMAQFMRCRCGLAVGERTQAAQDMTALMRHADLTVQAVGCALALYGMPLDDAEEVVLASDLPRTWRLYLYTLAEYVHALTLLQLGQVEQGMAVARAAYAITPSKTLADEFLLVITCCATAMEDSTTILTLPLTTDCRMYLAVAPAFFGGLQAAGIRLEVRSATYRLLYPRQLAMQASLRQMLPFHMNRASYFAGQCKFREAWDDACCAVAAADELVGSAEFAFTDCFSLQVFTASTQIASRLLLALLEEQVDVVLQCAAESEDAVLLQEAVAVMEANDRFAREVMRLGAEWAARARQFFPHSSVVEATQVLWASTMNEPRTLTRAALLARRFPRTVIAQNTFAFALFFAHRVPEAIDASQKNMQDFPHDAGALLVQQVLKEKNTVYVFAYRSVLPLRYSPANKRRFYTKRMIFAIILLAVHVAFACVTLIVNIPAYVTLPEAAKPIALRLQLPSAVPLIFCAVFLMQSLVATLSPVSLMHTLLSDLQFTNTWLTRFLFGMRGVVYANVINCIQISAAGNNFLIETGFFTFIFYFVVTLLSAPFTTRMWFLPSVDEPKVGVLSWLTLLTVDAVFAFLTFIPHVILAVTEPLSSIAFNFFIPAKRPSGDKVSSSIRRRLLYHKRYRYEMPSRYRPGSGSRYFHVRLMVGLFHKTHPPMDTAMMSDAQREEENYRAFPLVDPQLTDCVAALPLRSAEELQDIFGDLQATGEVHRAHELISQHESRPAEGESISVGSVMLDDMGSSSRGQASRGAEGVSFVNPMAQVQRAMERDEERQQQLFRRSASFVLTSANADPSRRPSRWPRRSLFAPNSRAAPASPSRRVNVLAGEGSDEDMELESRPATAQRSRGHRHREVSQQRSAAGPSYQNTYASGPWENPFVARRQ